MKDKKFNTKKLTQLSLLLCVAVVLGYIEVLIPMNVGLPGVKLGLPNIVSLYVLYMYGDKEGFGIGILRIAIIGLLFTGMYGCIYGFSGFIVSYILMCIIKKTKLFGIVGVSVAGAVMHNLVQLCVAFVITEVFNLIYYLWVLSISGLIAGLCTGLLTKIIMTKTCKLVNKAE